MAQKIIGLDIGSFSVKAAVFDTTFRSFQLTDLYESPPLKMDDLEAVDQKPIITEAILRLMQENNIDPATTTVIGLAGTQVSTKELILPLPESQVEKVLPFELEAFLPFELSDLIIDYHVLDATKNQTHLLAAAAVKTAIDERIKTVQAANMEPAFIALESASLFNLTLMNDFPSDKNIILVDIGHMKTSICFIHDGKIKQVRALFKGGFDLTDAIRSNLDLTHDQAVEVKHQHAIIELPNQPLRSADLQRLSAAIKPPMDELLSEIQQSISAYQAEKHSHDAEADAGIAHLYFCGGTSLVKNLATYATEYLAMPCSIYESNAINLDKLPIFAQAISLGLRASVRGANARRTVSINFRKDEFALAKDMTGVKNVAYFFGKWVFAIFFLSLFYQSLKFYELYSEKSKIEGQILKEFKRIMPDVKNPPKSSSGAIKMMNTKIKEYKDKQEVLTSGLGNMTALGVLKEISIQVPVSIPLDSQELSIDRNKVTLRATTDSFESVDKIIAALKQYKDFQKIEKGDIRETPEGRKLFTLNIAIGETETEKPKRSK